MVGISEKVRATYGVCCLLGAPELQEERTNGFVDNKLGTFFEQRCLCPIAALTRKSKHSQCGRTMSSRNIIGKEIPRWTGQATKLDPI
jgi:hypothetical protein